MWNILRCMSFSLCTLLCFRWNGTASVCVQFWVNLSDWGTAYSLGAFFSPNILIICSVFVCGFLLYLFFGIASTDFYSKSNVPLRAVTKWRFLLSKVLNRTSSQKRWQKDNNNNNNNKKREIQLACKRSSYRWNQSNILFFRHQVSRKETKALPTGRNTLPNAAF